MSSSMAAAGVIALRTSLLNSVSRSASTAVISGRKTYVNDARWIADLLAHGLIRASFVPPAPIQELRDLIRTRKQLVSEIAQHALRIQKVLEDANVKVGCVLSDVLPSAAEQYWAIIAGESDPRGWLIWREEPHGANGPS